MSTIQESKLRTVLKSALYILTHETLLFFVSWLVTGDAVQSVTIMVVGSFAEMVYYYAYERLWTKIKISVDKKKAAK